MIFKPYETEIDLIYEVNDFLNFPKSKTPPVFRSNLWQDMQDILNDLATAEEHIPEYL